MNLAQDLALTLDPTSVPDEPGRSSPAALGRAVLGTLWHDAPHLDALDEILVAAARDGGGRTIVTMPPRHGKSWLVSRFTPAWYLGTYPGRRCILTSYEADFALGWGRAVRDILEEYGPSLFGVTMRQDSKAANRWEIASHGGGMQTAGVGGPITGKGADLLIIDDPIKNAEEASSQVYRDRNWNWWQSTALTRLEPNASVVVIQTRWHEDDLAGRLIKAGGWDVVNLPAVAIEGDALGRKPGEALWPERYDVAALEDIRKQLGAYWWSALYQQHPQPEGGRLFKRQDFRSYTMTDVDGVYTYHLDKREGGTEAVDAKDCWTFSVVDLAVSVKDSADYTVVSTWTVTPKRDLILRDVVRVRLEGPDQGPLIKGVHDRYSPGFIGVESVAYQLTLVQELRRMGLPVRALKADRDKVSRALVAAARYEAHAVFHPEHASWLGDYEEEVLSFPTGAHDDQVDTAAYAATLLALGSGGEIVTGPDIWE